MRVSQLIFPLLFVVHSVCGQYVNSLGNVDIDRIEQELRALGMHSDAQKRHIKGILRSLNLERFENPTISNSSEKPLEVANVLHQLRFRIGDFEFLRPVDTLAILPDRALDTIEYRAIELENALSAILDSAEFLRQQLVKLIEAEHSTRATKEKATRVLAQSKGLSTWRYIFENGYSLEFSAKTKLEILEDESCIDCDRTGLISAVRSTVGLGSGFGFLERDWSVFPFIVEYLDDPNLGYSGGGLEFLWLHLLLNGYEQPWLISDFIYWNMDDKESAVAKLYQSLFDSEREKYMRSTKNADLKKE